MADFLELLKDQMFCSLKGVVWDMQSGVMGVTAGNDDEEIVTLTKHGSKYRLNRMPKTKLSMPVPAWAFRQTLDNLAVGDLLFLDDRYFAYYLGKGKSDTVENPHAKVLVCESGRTDDAALAYSTLFGTYGVLAVKNIMGESNMANMMPFLMMLHGEDEEEDVDAGKMIAMSMLMQQGGDNKNMMAMLPLLMGKGNSKDMMLMMMMQQGGMGGNMAGMMPFLMGGLGQPKPATQHSPQPAPRPAAIR